MSKLVMQCIASQPLKLATGTNFETVSFAISMKTLSFFHGRPQTFFQGRAKFSGGGGVPSPADAHAFYYHLSL